MPDAKHLCALLVSLVVSPVVVAQQAPSLKQLLELDTQRAAQEKPAPSGARPSPAPARPRMLAIYGPTGQRTVLVQWGAERLLFQENQPGSLPSSPYHLLTIHQHCASFRRTGSKTAQQVCLRSQEELAPQERMPRSPQPVFAPPALPWKVKEKS